MARVSYQSSSEQAKLRFHLVRSLNRHTSKTTLARVTREEVRTFGTSAEVRRKIRNVLRSRATRVTQVRRLARLVSEDPTLALGVLLRASQAEFAYIRANMMTKADGERILSALERLKETTDRILWKHAEQERRLSALEARCPAPGVGGA